MIPSGLLTTYMVIRLVLEIAIVGVVTVVLIAGILLDKRSWF